MKINKLKKYQSLAFATALSLLTGCGYTGNTMESSSEITLEKENNINTDTSELEEEKNTQFVYKKGSLSFTVNVNRDTLSLQTERETEENHELPTEFYEKINEILINQNIKKIELSKIGSEIDFTKLDLSNIERLLIIDCKEGFDSTAFTGKYSAIDFIDTSNLIIERVIGNCDCSDADIFISNSLDMSGDYSYKDIVNIKN